MNHALGAPGSTVEYIEPVEAGPPDQAASLARLVADMHAGAVQVLLILGGNPVYTAPADLDFAGALAALSNRPDAFTAHLGQYDDETSELCQWHVPEAHPLESWSDARAYDGTASIVQPLIAPLFDGKSAHEVIAAALGSVTATDHDVVRDYWRSRRSGADFEAFWRKSLHDGLIASSAHAPKSPGFAVGAGRRPGPDSALTTRDSRLTTPDLGPKHLNTRTPEHPSISGPSTLNPQPSTQEFSPHPFTPSPPHPLTSLELIFHPDPAIHDGRFANNAWLQELPKPLTKLTWDNAALLSPRTAQQYGLSDGDVVELQYRGRTVQAPILILPGHTDGAVTAPLGFGRRRAGSVGTGVGFNAYALRTSDSPWFGDGLELRKTGRRVALATTRSHHGMEGRELVREATLPEFQRNPNYVHQTDREKEPPAGLTLYPNYKYEGYAWGMSIDTTACIGCSACVVACQAENNIPIVGKGQVMAGREMHWLRIDRYYKGTLEDPDTLFLPVPCMQCEDAPCELVCPVGATVHDKEGLNEMVYNRCVGTRYCSNNCPYKVRRFNFLKYEDERPTIQLMRNPEVTVRTRGVMEKCTYCIQRIEAARIQAEKENRPIREQEVVTACQQACPTRAIVFGNQNDQASQVAGLKKQPHNYALLAELNTRPRTTYLGKLRNPNPEMEDPLAAPKPDVEDRSRDAVR